MVRILFAVCLIPLQLVLNGCGRECPSTHVEYLAGCAVAYDCERVCSKRELCGVIDATVEDACVAECLTLAPTVDDLECYRASDCDAIAAGVCPIRPGPSSSTAQCGRDGGDLLCVDGDGDECAGPCESWTGALCCVNHANACTAGTPQECSDANEAWTGALCCVLAQ